MRAREFISEEQRLNEFLPLVGLAARAIGGAVAKKAAGGIAQRAGANIARKAVGTIAGNKQTKQSSNPIQDRNAERAKDQLIKPGATVNLPTDNNKTQNYKVTKVTGDEVEIENPAIKQNPNQPNKLVYKKQDLKKSLNI